MEGLEILAAGAFWRRGGRFDQSDDTGSDSEPAIARQLQLDIKTVRKRTRRDWGPQRRRRSRGRKLEP